MRFPWLQVDSDFISSRSSELGALLGISRREALGLALDLWAWTLSRSPADRPPDGILSGSAPVPVLASAVSWPEPERLLSALVEVGLVEVIPEGLRIKGLDRYRATWEKNKRRPVRNRTGPGTGSPPEPVRKTHTHTHTQKEEDTPPSPPRGEEAPAQRSLLDDEKPQETPPEALQALWNRVAAQEGRPRWVELKNGRERLARRSLKACPDLGRWEAYLRWRLKDPFYRGERDWTGADVEWFLRTKTAREVCDFDPAKPPPVPGRQRPGRFDTTPSDFSTLPEEGEDLGTFDLGGENA